MIRMILIGDVSLQRSDPDSAFLPNMEVFAEPDIFFCNLETVVADASYLPPDDPSPKTFVGTYPRTDEALFPAYQRAGINIVNMANNVGFHHGYVPFVRSLEVVEASGMAFVGAGHDLERARKPVVVERNGTKVAFVCRTAIFTQNAGATVNKAGMAVFGVATAYQPQPRAHEVPGSPPIVRSFPNSEDCQALGEDIARARQGADVVVASWHWGIGPGTGGAGQLAEYQTEMAHFCIDAGADLVVGHHPNLLCPIEVYKGKVIAYALGNYVHDTASFSHQSADTMILQCGIEGRQIRDVSFIPGRIEGCGPAHYGSRGEMAEVIDRLRSLSAPLKTQFEVGETSVKVRV